MDIHLVGGFLGSGKTTAIIAASRRLVAEGLKVGVVTNDQGRYLVDSAFVRAGGVPTVEVTGGCFCCNYDDFARVIVALGRSARPDVVFAESVGSCADLVATVVKPLVAGARAAGRLRSLSAFADIRLLDRWLDGRPLPFSESVSYIFGKQLEEAGAVVVNKADLVSAEQARSVFERAAERFAPKPVRLQSSLRDEDVAGWLGVIALPEALPSASLAIDYDTYGSGEAELAWLDARIRLHCGGGGGSAGMAATAAVEAVLAGIARGLDARGAPVGHVKALIECGGASVKVSLTAGDAGPPRVPRLGDASVSLLLNARAQIAADELRRIVREALDAAAARHGFLYEVDEEEAFHPGRPTPTHRIP